ncbi:hypothetical protein SDC9_148929 [bioreactor metagenome]|uniref:Uncharacterized protein n=1 Tax=bioreactor metagenome TaxID=1076179 RepID=A0A645EI86_9ZZZZ
MPEGEDPLGNAGDERKAQIFIRDQKQGAGLLSKFLRPTANGGP